MGNLKENIYEIYAVAVYQSGSFSSEVAKVTVGAPPISISMTQRDNRSPGAFTVTCTPYSGTPGAVNDVDFYVNGSYWGYDYTAPYSRTFGNLKADAYSVQAKVNYTNGDSFFSSAISILVKAPNVRLKLHAKNRRQSKSIRAGAVVQPTSPGDVNYVKFYLNRYYYGSDSSSPYNFRFSRLTGRKYRVTAVAILSNGDEVQKTSKVIRFRR